MMLRFGCVAPILLGSCSDSCLDQGEIPHSPDLKFVELSSGWVVLLTQTYQNHWSLFVVS